MNKIIIALLIGMLMMTSVVHAQAKKYKNCTELNKVYRGGVAMPKAVNKGGKTKFTPTFDSTLYAMNKGLDRDKDNIACEQ